MQPTAIADEAGRLAEALAAESRDAIIAPGRKRLQQALGRRFRAQLRQWQKTGSIVVDDQKFDPLFERLTQQAYRGGIRLAAADLAILREAAGDDDGSDDGGSDDDSSLPWYLLALLPWVRRARDLVRQIDSTTVKVIRRILARRRGVEPDKVAGLATDDKAERRLIRETFQDWAKSGLGHRSEDIAENELLEALADGQAAAARAVRKNEGVEVEKSWYTAPEIQRQGPCPICLGNESDGWIPEDLPFASGNFHAPAHNHCCCATIYRQSSGSPS